MPVHTLYEGIYVSWAINYGLNSDEKLFGVFDFASKSA
jgi:hypothetical protein